MVTKDLTTQQVSNETTEGPVDQLEEDILIR